MVVEPTELNEVVERLTGSTDPGPWRSEELYQPVASATAGIWRVSGDGWSVVLKIVQHGNGRSPNWPSSSDPDDWSYWKREVLAYRSGFTSCLVGGLRGPALLGSFDRADGAVALWLEDVGRGVAATSWAVPDYEPAAGAIGRAQGALLLAPPAPAASWLSQGWLRAYAALRHQDMHLLGDDQVWDLPLVRDNMSPSWAVALRQMYVDQPLFLDTLDRLPRAVCHFDLHPANLFAVDDDTVLIDWASVGMGAVGEDPGVLVADAVLDFHVGPELVDDLCAVVRGGYEDGLRQAGWSGPSELVVLGMSAGLAARYAWIGPALLRCVAEQRPMMNRRPSAEAVAVWARTLPFLMAQAETARQLAADF